MLHYILAWLEFSKKFSFALSFNSYNLNFFNYSVLTDDFGSSFTNIGATFENFACAYLYHYTSNPFTGGIWNFGITYAVGSSVAVDGGGGLYFTNLGQEPAPTAVSFILCSCFM